MRISTALTWSLGAATCLWLSWNAWRPPVPSEIAEPTALPRPPTQDERETLERQAVQLSAWIEQAKNETGRTISLEQVEAHLPQPIFDNPLVDGVGGIQQSCPVDALDPPGLDWVYCPDTSQFAPNIPTGRPM